MDAEKPSRKIFNETLDRLGTTPENATYFGDNLQRDATAEEYGWYFIWVYGFRDNTKPSEFDGKKIKFITGDRIKKYL